MKIGRLIQQPTGYKAFIPDKFPLDQLILLSQKTHQLNARAVFLLGKLDGITQLLPDLDFFILMYITKEAARSSEIEGTRATIVDVIKSEADIEHRLPEDVERILHYIKAMEYGLKWSGQGFLTRNWGDLRWILLSFSFNIGKFR